MRGHEQLIALRRRGLCPSLVLLDLLPGYTLLSSDWQLGGHYGNGVAHIELLEAESISRLDLRFLVRLKVLVSGAGTAAVERLHRAVVGAGAAWVFSQSMEPVGGGEFRTVWTQFHDGGAHG